MTWSKLASLAGQGAAPKSTPLTEEYDFEAFNADQGRQGINLFALDGSQPGVGE